MEDLDRVAPGSAERQLADLGKLGLDWDGAVMWQSQRGAAHRAAITALENAGLVYECFCTRREIQRAPSAPHAPQGAYPGTCRNLTTDQVRERRIAGRPPAVRLRAGIDSWTVHDALIGDYTGAVDDLVLRRGDGVAAYNLAVVVDDAGQAVDQVVRGDDLLSSAPRQAYLAQLLGLPPVGYAHVPLARNVRGARLAKRDGAVTLADLEGVGKSAADVLELIAVSLDLAQPGEHIDIGQLLERFEPNAIPRTSWIVDPQALGADQAMRRA